MIDQTLLPPSSTDAESAVLGAMLLSADAVAEACEILTPDYFFNPMNGETFLVMRTMFVDGEKPDTVSVMEALRRRGLSGEPDSPIKPEDLAGHTQATPYIGSVGQYARTVRDMALMRLMMRAGAEIHAKGASRPEDVTKALAEAESTILGLAEETGRAKGRLIVESLPDLLDDLERLYDLGGDLPGVSSGWGDLDEIIHGYQDEELIVVCGRPGMGKTAYAAGAIMPTLEAGLEVLFFSLEMSELQLNKRLLSSVALVDSTKLLTGAIEPPEWKRIETGIGKLAGLPLTLIDNPTTSVLDIRSRAVRAKRNGNLGLVVVDYLQLMRGSGRGGSGSDRQAEIAEISRELKVLARDLKVPVVALAQLNRGLESRVDKRPQMSDLRESGALEQDADKIVGLYRDEVYDDESPDRGVAELIVLKNRNGGTGKAKLAFRGQYTRFDQMARPRWPSQPKAAEEDWSGA